MTVREALRFFKRDRVVWAPLRGYRVLDADAKLQTEAMVIGTAIGRETLQGKSQTVLYVRLSFKDGQQHIFPHYDFQ